MAEPQRAGAECAQAVAGGQLSRREKPAGVALTLGSALAHAVPDSGFALAHRRTFPWRKQGGASTVATMATVSSGHPLVRQDRHALEDAACHLRRFPRYLFDDRRVEGVDLVD